MNLTSSFSSTYISPNEENKDNKRPLPDFLWQADWTALFAVLVAEIVN